MKKSLHFGGLWEARKKSVKTQLAKAIGETVPNMEEMYTILIQIEVVSNSRPLSAIGNDINDLEALTSAHFMIVEPLIVIQQEIAESNNKGLLRKWQLTQQINELSCRRCCSGDLEVL
uniref:Uncharacterized protein n=1 Tax=Glossina morsitans morsitans TaxID=37546 RepID=A0A1A9YUE6_GLOMM